MAMAARPFHLVVWGASGFTGKLVCEHMARDYPGQSIKWALGGRNQAKLEKVRQDLCSINPDMKHVPILVADARDGAEMGALLQQTKVVLSVAGPFAQIGNEVVEQAVAQGTHYCDITGEVTWVKRNAEKYHAQAEEKEIKIVHCCGYDSVPSDIGALMVAQHFKKQGKKTAKVYTITGDSKGGVSGGTLASLMNMVKTDAEEMKKQNRDAYYLASLHGRRGSDKPASFLPQKVPETGEWVGPFIMEGCNGRLCHLSNALLGYGPDFKYLEVMGGGKGWAGFIKSCLVSFFTIVIGLSLSTGPGQYLMSKVAPKQGEGPSLELQRTGYWSHNVLGVAEDGQLVKAEVAHKHGDPGYWSTSRMVLESALCLALEDDAIRASGTCKSGGVLTPASAMGMFLLERLRKAGYTFEMAG